MAFLGAGVAMGTTSPYTGPEIWNRVQTNAVRAWQEAAQRGAADRTRVWPGVIADAAAGEVRLLAEAVGHASGVILEFVAIGPLSDRAYESVAVSVAAPGDIARAIEALGVARGGGIGSRPFRFWPVGERIQATVRRLDIESDPARPITWLLNDREPNEPLVGAGGLVFTGGRWDEKGVCLTDNQMPASVISVYNEPFTILDVPFQAGQSAVYGRVTLAQDLKAGELLEFVFRPLWPADGQPRVLPLSITAMPGDGGPRITIADSANRTLHDAPLADALTWLRARADEGREPFVTLGMSDELLLRQAAEVARVFNMLDGRGLKFDGRSEGGLYPRAFVPQETWREREGRMPQPFELHVTRNEAGGLAKRLVFIEEDWTVPGLDPKLMPRDYPFDAWEQLPELVERAGGPENRVRVLFVFAPADLPLGSFMPGVRAVSKRLPLAHVFAD